VTGSGFSGATAVNFGSLAATSFSVTSATTQTGVSSAVAGASAVVEPNCGVRRFERPYLITPPSGLCLIDSTTLMRMWFGFGFGFGFG
jgi:hypothetical protein